MADPVDAFRRWLGSNEINSAEVRTASAEESLGLLSSSIAAETARIASLLARSGGGQVHPAWRWATDIGSYPTVADAHLQYLALWFAEHARRALPHLAVGQPIPLAGVLRSRKRTPFVENVVAGHAFVALPSGFLASADLYFRAHFRLRELGLPAPATAGCVATDAFGGQAVERAFVHAREAADGVLLQLESGFLAAELFDPDLDDGAPESGAFDFYDPELIRSAAQVTPELTGRAGPYVPLRPTAESRAAAYLCALFALFHELAHQLVGDDGVAMAQALGIAIADEETAVEAAVDVVALPAYAAYVDEQSRAQPEFGPIAAVLHPARFSVGTAALHSVGKAVEFARWSFDSAQPAAPAQRDGHDRARRTAIVTLQNRQVALAERLWRNIGQAAQGTLDRWHLLCYGAFLEARCVEAALRMRFSRLRHRRAGAFCDHYEG